MPELWHLPLRRQSSVRHQPQTTQALTLSRALIRLLAAIKRGRRTPLHPPGAPAVENVSGVDDGSKVALALRVRRPEFCDPLRVEHVAHGL